MGLKEKIASWIYQHLNADKLIADKGGIKLYKEVVKDAYGNICETLRSFKGLTPFKTIEKTTTDIRRPYQSDLGQCRSFFTRRTDAINHITGKRSCSCYTKYDLVYEDYPPKFIGFNYPDRMGGVAVQLKPNATIEKWDGGPESWHIIHKLPSIEGDVNVYQDPKKLLIKRVDERHFQPFVNPITSYYFKG